MAVPTTYTEAHFKAYLHTVLGAFSDSLGWTIDAGDYDEVVNDALLAYGTTDIGKVDGAEPVRKLRALGRLAVWRRVAAVTAGHFSYSADGGRYSREQVHEHAVAMVTQLETECMAWLPEYAARTQRIDFEHDPYEDRDYDERTL